MLTKNNVRCFKSMKNIFKKLNLKWSHHSIEHILSFETNKRGIKPYGPIKCQRIILFGNISVYKFLFCYDDFEVAGFN